MADDVQRGPQQQPGQQLGQPAAQRRSEGITQREREMLAILDGSRSTASLGQAAVRLEDLAGLLSLAPTLRSAHAAADPVTPVEFDALVDDMHRLFEHVLAVSTAIQIRRRV